MRQHPQTRSQRREERYSALKEKGQTLTMDNLYLSEVRKLRKEGYTVEIVSPHPTHRNLLLCQVIFP